MALLSVRIKDREQFEAVVFGADCFLKQYPEFAAGGLLPVQELFDDGWYYVMKPDRSWYVDHTAFFTMEEINSCMELVTVG